MSIRAQLLRVFLKSGPWTGRQYLLSLEHRQADSLCFNIECISGYSFTKYKIVAMSLVKRKIIQYFKSLSNTSFMTSFPVTGEQLQKIMKYWTLRQMCPVYVFPTKFLVILLKPSC